MSKVRGRLRPPGACAREGLKSFELVDGTTYYYDGLETHKELFLYAYDVQLGAADKWDKPPEIFRKMCEAKDPHLVLERFKPENSLGAFVDPTALFDTDALIQERRLVPVSYKPPEDLSEPQAT